MLPSRRELADLAIRAVALPGAAPFLTAWLQAADDHQHAASSKAPPQPPLLQNYKPSFFPPPDFAALQAYTEILIPTDDTPGAKEAYCAHFIDFLLHSADQAPALQKQWRDALAKLKELGFHQADAAGKAALVEAMSRPERERGATHPAYDVYRLIKQQNTFAFYTSRVGMIDTLDYRGNSYNATFPACNHPEHHRL